MSPGRRHGARTAPVTPSRLAALEALARVDDQGAYASKALDDCLRKKALSNQERAFATELVYGVLRWRNRLDYALSHFAQKPVERLSTWTRGALRIAAYQILFLNSVPGPVACNETVELVKVREPWAAGFANGVCRAFMRGYESVSYPDLAEEPVRAIAVVESHPEWMVERWHRRFGASETLAMCRANNETPGVTLRVNEARISVEEAARALREAGVEVRPGALSPAALRLAGAGSIASLPGYREGHFQIQDESSQLVAWALDPDEHGRVADLCSAPGGKTTHLAERLACQAGARSAALEAPPIAAFDRHRHRLARVGENAERLGVSSLIELREGDARDIRARDVGRFACVLIDAPCSGTGVLRRRADLRWRKRPEDIGQLVRTQREILEAGAELVADGGVLLYATCSVETEENEENASWFLDRFPEFSPSSLWEHLPLPARSKLLPNRFGLSGSTLQLFPHRDGTDGFFLFRAVKAKGE